ncbi:hypothetical protein ACFQ1Q_12175 [Winogradskyella litorisediminis]|uniref:Curlin associated repeat-containing protein n=1 Tax=Winogradskyella litorisediminis TaxID=1156618 RepID=A0ABW3NCB9_9FLAO
MKNSVLFLIAVSFITSLSFSQDKSSIDNRKTKRVSDIYNYKQDTSNYLLLNQIEDVRKGNQDLNKSLNSDNLVIIRQIGDRNISISNTNSTTSSISYLQIGNNNRIESASLIPNTSENIIQRGNNNNLVNFSFGNAESTALQVIQNGNNLTFDKFGANKLTNSLTVRVTGNNQSVIVRSF